MFDNIIRIFRKVLIVMLVLVLLSGTVCTIYVMAHLRPAPDREMKPIFQTDAVWCSQDGKITFQAQNGSAAKGTILDGEGPIDVKVSTDMSGHYVSVYLPSFSADGTPLHDPELDVENWTFHSKGEDWFTVNVTASTYYEEGSTLTFYMQTKSD